MKKEIENKNKIFVYGNGGSYADVTFCWRINSYLFFKKKKPLPFILLGSNMAAITAWSNDFKFEDYLTREFSSYASKKDVLFLFSTSGGNTRTKQSINLVKLAKFAKSKKMKIIVY